MSYISVVVCVTSATLKVAKNLLIGAAAGSVAGFFVGGTLFRPKTKAENKKAESKEFTVEIREALPAHFLTKIRVSPLLDNSAKFCESAKFTVDGNTWSVIISSDGGHISAHVKPFHRLSPNWDLKHAVFKIFLFNHHLDKYLCYRGNIGDAGLFTKFISKKALRDPRNRFVVDGSCVFGVEIFIDKAHQVVHPSIRLSNLKGVEF